MHDEKLFSETFTTSIREPGFGGVALEVSFRITGSLDGSSLREIAGGLMEAARSGAPVNSLQVRIVEVKIVP